MIPAGAINCSSMSAVAAAPTKFETSSPSVLNAIRNGLLAAERRNKNVFNGPFPASFSFISSFHMKIKKYMIFASHSSPRYLMGPYITVRPREAFVR